MVGSTDTLVKISESDSIDPPRLDGQPSPPYTPGLLTVLGPPHPTPMNSQSQQFHRSIDLRPYVTS